MEDRSGLCFRQGVRQSGTCRGKAPPSCYTRPFCRLKSPLGTSLLRCASQTRTCRGKAPPSCCARPFGRLKSPLGLSLFCFAPQTRICLLFLIIEVNDECSHHSNSKNNAPLWCIDPICKDGTTYIPNNYGYDHC